MIVKGAGFGHGIGMSQYGAYGYSLEGSGYKQILAHYYEGTTMTTAPEPPGARAAAAQRPVHPRRRARPGSAARR